MTGHQEHAGTELDLLGNRCTPGHRADRPRHGGQGADGRAALARRSHRYKAVRSAILADGVKVVIADKECGITYHRRACGRAQADQGTRLSPRRKTHMNITPEVCENCLECTKATACPGLTTIDTDYGRKIDTDLTWCVNDGACERVRSATTRPSRSSPAPASSR
jgi:indolepyruvate ferredoxin oxidoreductase